MIVKLNKDVVLGSDTQDGSLTLKNNQGQETAKLTATEASSSWTQCDHPSCGPIRNGKFLFSPARRSIWHGDG